MAAVTSVVLPVPEIRDFDRINGEVVQLLNEGVTHIVLAGVERQRLLCLRLIGPWNALIEVQGNPGPELAAEMNAPGLTVIATGNAAEGIGRALTSGRLIVGGNVGDGVGYCQRGGTILVKGNAGHRAGLMQAGGSLIVLGSVGRLAGERQSGGLFIHPGNAIGPHVGHGQLGGRRLSFPFKSPLHPFDRAEIDRVINVCGEHLPPGLLVAE